MPTPYKLLIVEDNEGDVILIEEYLNEHTPIPVYTIANSLKDAFIILDSDTTFDAILLDLTLPDATGELLVTKMLNKVRNIPVIILTGYTNRDFGIKAVALGVSDYLQKDDLTSYVLLKSITYSIERTKINRSLRHSELQYRDLFDLNPLPMWVFELDSLKFLSVNEAAIKSYGYTRDEFLNMTIMDIRPKEEIPNLMDSLKVIRETGSYNSGVFKHQKKSGEIIEVEIQANRIDFNGRPSELILSNDITERRIYQEKILKSLKEKETLLSEIHHRVKNNLAIVSGMMQLQAYQEEDLSIQTKLLDSVSRIQTMATIHEHLYQESSFSKINFSDNLSTLVHNIIETFKNDIEIQIDFNCDSIDLNINQAVPCSLIVNEVLTNILKHAFPSRKTGSIKFDLQIEDEVIDLMISDDGIGLPKGFSEEKSESLGLLLIKILTEQLGGNYGYKSSNAGTIFHITFQHKPDITGSASSII